MPPIAMKYGQKQPNRRKITLAQSQKDMPQNCLTVECGIPNDTWYVNIAPTAGWIPTVWWVIAGIFSLILSIMTATIFYQLYSKKISGKAVYR